MTLHGRVRAIAGVVAVLAAVVPAAAGAAAGDARQAQASPRGADGPVAAAFYRSCRDVLYRFNGAVYARTHELKARRVSCRSARRVARRWLATAEGTRTTPRPYGYRCRLSRSVVMHCRKRGRIVRWYTVER